MPNVDLAKRRRIMRRSMKLGHCICDPKRNCPCDVFTDRGLCPCAGERPEPIALEDVRLTERVHNTGCASKIAPGDLEAVLSRLPNVADPAVISGMPAGDDAGVYRLDGGEHLVQTVDLMTPCTDDPRLFGRICAANCLSDIYAMGGVPRTALSVLAFPAESLDGRIMYEMLAGAMEVFAEADVALIGGHSIKDEEIKLGFAITGTLEPDAIARHDTARVGDVLVLTKALGAGVLSFCRQIGRDGVDMAPVEASMAALNRGAADAAREVGVSACTDVTGFGLFGHLIGMARHSAVTAQIHADSLPAFDGSIEALADGVVPGAIERNREYVAEDIAVADGVDAARVDLGFDAQTSGGLLFAVPARRHEALLDALAARGVPAATIGRIVGESDGKIQVTLSHQGPSAAPVRQVVDDLPRGEPTAAPCRGEPAEPASCREPRTDEPKGAEPCCGEPAGQATSSTPDASRAFGAFMRSVTGGGRIDERTKELITFALVNLSRCGPCVQAHMARALKMGISREELDEAVWLATAIGGAPVRMFYQETLKAPADQGPGGCCG